MICAVTGSFSPVWVLWCYTNSSFYLKSLVTLITLLWFLSSLSFIMTLDEIFIWNPFHNAIIDMVSHQYELFEYIHIGIIMHSPFYHSCNDMVYFSSPVWDCWWLQVILLGMACYISEWYFFSLQCQCFDNI